MPNIGTADVGNSIARYDARLQPTYGSGETAFSNPWFSPVQLAFANDSKARMHAWLRYQAIFVRATQQVLNVEGVATILYAAYLGFANEMGRLIWNGNAGTSLQLESLVLLNKWVARGLTQSVLEAIRLQVFNVVAPTVPPPP